MAGSPAPEVVLSVLSCRCTCACKPSECAFVLNGLECTAARKLQDCANMTIDNEDIEQDYEDSCDSENDED